MGNLSRSQRLLGLLCSSVGMCGLCWDAFEKNLYPEPPSYPSAEVLWTSHSLAPLGDWCSEKLARATGVGFWDYDGMLVAKLVFSDDDAQGAV